MLKKIVSGGQTGVDRAALDAAISSNLQHGGWCPQGRRAEDGRIAESYQLVETPQSLYPQRTAWNVRDSDGTLILARKSLQGGTLYTMQRARKAHKPFLIVSPDDLAAVAQVRQWIETNAIEVLNVAGPRASSEPGIYAVARRFLDALIPACLP
ncbi:MAG: molybdenum cofactor carrier [Chlorobium sp.]|nr:MAG: molybdenum cofactor carrier [Chlorobium sp.]